jgi:hypothetical protein
MAMDYLHLDERTRKFMLLEINDDHANGKLYFSKNLSAGGVTAFPEMLKSAAAQGNDVSLAQAIRPHLNSHELPRKLTSGGYSAPPIMRSNAHEMLAEGEFTRFYLRGLCLRAIEDHIPAVLIYRAKHVENARSASTEKIGTSHSPASLLDDLRAHPGLDTALGLPPGPNSGLCAKLP